MGGQWQDQVGYWARHERVQGAKTHSRGSAYASAWHHLPAAAFLHAAEQLLRVMPTQGKRTFALAQRARQGLSNNAPLLQGRRQLAGQWRHCSPPAPAWQASHASAGHTKQRQHAYACACMHLRAASSPTCVALRCIERN